MTDTGAANIGKLRRKRTTLRSIATRFVSLINALDDSTPTEEVEYCQDRLQETLKELIALNDKIHDLLDDIDYEADTQVCKEYTLKCKRAIRKAKGFLGARPGKAGTHLLTSAFHQHAHMNIKGWLMEAPVHTETVFQNQESGDELSSTLN